MEKFYRLHAFFDEDGEIKDVLTKELFDLDGVSYAAVEAMFGGVILGCYVPLNTIDPNGVGIIEP